MSSEVKYQKFKLLGGKYINLLPRFEDISLPSIYTQYFTTGNIYNY
jgi:hypothetical protein